MNLPAVTILTTGADGDGNSTCTTASVSPVAKQPIFLHIATDTTISTNPNTPTITGLGLTWVLYDSQLYDSTSTSRRKGFTFIAFPETVPTPGTIGIDWGGQNQGGGVVWAVEQISNTRRDGVAGAGAIRQSAKTYDESGSVSTLSVNLAATPFPNNCIYAVFFNDGIGGGTGTAGSGFTKKGEVQSGSNIGLATEFRTGIDTSVDFSYPVNTYIAVIAMEIATATIKDIVGGGGPVAYNR